MFIIFFSAWSMSESNHEKEQAIINRHVDQNMQAIQMRIKSYEHVLMSSAGLFNASVYVDKDEWKDFVNSLNIHKNYPGVCGFGFIERVTPDKLAEFISSEETVYNKSVQIQSLEAPIEGDKYIIKYIEPIERNEKTRWLEIGSNPLRRDAAERAMLLGNIQITEIIELVQDRQKKPSFLMLYPLYKTKSIPVTVSERRSQLYGWAYAPFVGEEIMAGIEDPSDYKLKFNIYDNEIASHKMIYGGIDSKNLEFEKAIKREVKIGELRWIFVWNSTGKISASDLEVTSVIVLGVFSSMGLLILMLLLTRQSEKAIESMEDALNAKSDFLSVMSHEIRTPLHGVIGMSELLKTEMTEEIHKEKIDLIYQSGQALLSLVNDILDFSKIEKGKIIIEALPFQPSKSIEEAIQLFKKQIDIKQLDVSLNSHSCNEFILSDSLRFRQIMLNLLSNAIKFTEHGYIKVNVKIEYKKLWVEIQDSGIGMSKEVIAKVFQPFTQADQTISRRFGGSGLGMSIVIGLIKAMKGDVVIDSQENCGTSVSFSIPVELCDRPAATESIQMESLGFNVLLVEDNLINQKLASKILTKMNCNYSIANNGHEAIEQYLKGGFEVILMDCSMPVMDGYEATVKLRAMGCKLPIIAFSANVGEDAVEKCRKSGMDDYLIKPVKSEDVYKKLKQYLS